MKTLETNIVSMIHEVKNAPTPKSKKEVLEKYRESTVLRKILFYTFNPYLKYGISKKMLDKIEPNGDIPNVDLYSLLDELAQNNINNDFRLKFVNFLSMFADDVKEIMIGIAIKDLDLGISATTVNKVWPKLIPSFNLQLAAKFQGIKLDENERIWVTEKFDGIRCVCIVSKGKINFFTRQGKEVFGLNDIIRDIKAMNLDEVVLDGELLYNKEVKDSAEQYKKTTKIVNSKMEDKKDIAFNMFDILTVTEFKLGESVNDYEDRREHLNEIKDTENIIVAKVLYEGTDHSRVMECHHDMMLQSKEGVMVNRNAKYSCSRTKNLLKVKVMNDADLKVIGYEEGRGENEGRLGALVVDYKGNTVNVGSGYSKEDRIHFWKIKDELVGRVIKVQYFEESKNSEGKKSLRFPVFLELRELGKEVSYN